MPNEDYLLQIMENIGYHLGQLNIHPYEWYLTAHLLRAKHPVSEASLAQALNRPRTTIRGYLEDGIRMGFIERTPQGITLTASGRPQCLQLVREILEVASRRSPGFTEETLVGIHNAQKLSKKKRPFRLEEPPRVEN